MNTRARELYRARARIVTKKPSISAHTIESRDTMFPATFATIIASAVTLLNREPRELGERESDEMVRSEHVRMASPHPFFLHKGVFVRSLRT